MMIGTRPSLYWVRDPRLGFSQFDENKRWRGGS